MTADAPSPRFHPIVNPRAHEEVIDQVTFAIRAGYYGPGDRLPHMEELAQLMGVSKPTVGEALKVLSGAGVIETRRGSTGGVVVVDDVIPVGVLGMTVSERNWTPVELIEARRPIEIRLAQMAGQRATVSDFDQLEKALTQTEEVVEAGGDEYRRRAHYDHLFHYLIGRAARSESLAYYQHKTLEQLMVHLSDYFQHVEDPEMVVELHWETFDALRSREDDAIEKVMEKHLRPLEEYVHERFGEEPTER